MMESCMKSLKLDSAYRPIEVIDSLEALVLCIIGKAIAIENYTKEIRSPSSTFKIPAVIVLKRLVKFRFNNISPSKRNIAWRDNNQCQYCGKIYPVEELTVDHILPKSRGGLNTWTNLVCACKKCNQRKGCRTPQECGMIPIREPVKPKATLLKAVKKAQISTLWKDYLWEKT